MVAALAVISSEPIAGNQRAATINVYRRTSPQSSWRLEARLVPEPRAPGSTSGIGDPIAISADGNTIAYGNWVEYQYTGGVYLFRRGPAGWAQTQRITGRAGGADQFGINVKLDSAGRTLVVGRNQPGLERRDGTLEVYQDPDDGSDQFVHATTVPTPPFDEPQWGWCRAVDLSDAGHIVRSCFSGAPYAPIYTQVFLASTSGPLHYTEVAQLPGGADIVIDIDAAGTRVALPAWAPNAHVAVFRNDSGNWVAENTLGPFPTGINDIAISNDGRFIAVGMNDDTLVGRGPLFGYLTRGSVQSGSVGVFERRASGWRLRRYVKADSDNARHSFGFQVALSQNGHVLAVGSPYDAGAAKGIDGDRDDQSASGRGAVWLY